ncbi:hypothetical protein EG831_06980 [bacterium]|nr:hypothetical protein [bacterium]
MDHRKRLAEIRDGIWDGWHSDDVDDDRFARLVVELHGLHADTQDNDCLWLVSELYHSRAEQSKRMVSRYARMALERDPDNAGIHENIAYGSNVRTRNFKDIDHQRLVEFYRGFIDAHPGSIIGHRILLECLIDNHRMAEALDIIGLARSRFSATAFLWDVYRGEVLFGSGEQGNARELWERTCAENKDDPRCLSMVGEHYANLGLYDAALAKYAAAFDLRQPPRKVDDLIGMYRILDIQKDYAKSLATIDRIIDVYRTDWGTEHGIDIDALIGEKNRIMGKMNELVR